MSKKIIVIGSGQRGLQSLAGKFYYPNMHFNYPISRFYSPIDKKTIKTVLCFARHGHCIKKNST